VTRVMIASEAHKKMKSVNNGVKDEQPLQKWHHLQDILVIWTKTLGYFDFRDLKLTSVISIICWSLYCVSVATL